MRATIPTYYVASDIYLCEVDGSAIFLDLGKASYFAIDNSSLNIFKLALSNPSSIRDVDTNVLRSFLERGILTNDSSNTNKLPTPSIATRISAAPLRSNTYDRPIKTIDILKFIESLIFVALNLRRSRLKSMINRLKARKCALPAGSNVDQRELRALVSIFRRLSLWVYPRRNACLFDSLALADFLARCNMRATVVFGVANKPFEAHAWVQFEDEILNDSLERAQSYTAIFAA